MEKRVCYVAHENDLYEIHFVEDGSVVCITIYPDNDGQLGEEVSIWTLPADLRNTIRRKVDECLL